MLYKINAILFNLWKCNINSSINRYLQNSLEISNSSSYYNVYSNKNVTLTDNKIVFICWKLKCTGHIGKTMQKIP